MIRLDLNDGLNKKIEMALQKAPKQTKKALELSFFSIGQDMATEARSLAPYKTGNLRGSITVVSDSNKAIVGTNLIYARIHDLGGTIRAMTIRPKRGTVLRFSSGGKIIYSKFARIPARRINPYKGKGYLTPAFNRMKNGKAVTIISNHLDKIF